MIAKNLSYWEAKWKSGSRTRARRSSADLLDGNHVRRGENVRQTQFWKRYTCAIALLILPALCKADVILDWNAIMEAMVTTQPPFPQARFAAITQLAVF